MLRRYRCWGGQKREGEGRKESKTNTAVSYIITCIKYLDLTTCGSMDHPACNRMQGAIHQAIFVARGLATLSLSLQVIHHSYSLSLFLSFIDSIAAQGLLVLMSEVGRL